MSRPLMPKWRPMTGPAPPSVSSSNSFPMRRAPLISRPVRASRALSAVKPPLRYQPSGAKTDATRRPMAFSATVRYRSTSGSSGKVPRGSLGAVAHLDPGHRQPVAQRVGEGPLALGPQLGPQVDERFDVGAENIAGVAQTFLGGVAQPDDHGPERGPAPVELVGLEGVA